MKTTIGQSFSTMPWKWDWTNAFHVVEAYKSTLTSRIVIYNKPNWGSWNHNTDGSFTGGQGMARRGGIFRNKYGHMIMAFASPIQVQTYNFSEIQGAL